MATLGGFLCVEGDTTEIMIVRNTFIDSQRLCHLIKRSRSAPPIRNSPEEHRRALLLPQWNGPGGDIESLHEDEVNSSITRGSHKGKHGNFQTDPWAQRNQGTELPSTQCESVPEGLSVVEPSWSLGSARHHEGLCKPCAWFRKRGCTLGGSCAYCHLCGDGEIKARKKQKGRLLKQLRKCELQALHPGLQAPAGITAHSSGSPPSVATYVRGTCTSRTVSL